MFALKAKAGVKGASRRVAASATALSLFRLIKAVNLRQEGAKVLTNYLVKAVGNCKARYIADRKGIIPVKLLNRKW
jgi:hypothetical protein